MQTQQAKSLRITAQRAFQLVQREQVGDESRIVGHKIVKPGETVTVDRALGLELVAGGKAQRAEEAPAARGRS